ncbi:MAG TPA: CDP-glycerol glycerophosphotransferase family protein [Lachnospiraceae bacterium]|nr:CDP-glycerol glycerophosphotransferase family protein [Lachnospiraceae bacterium]
MRDIKEKWKYWLQIFLIPVYWLSFLVFRDKKVWVFGSTFGRRFAENPRYLYLYINQSKQINIRPIWISKNKEIVKSLGSEDCEAYYYRSIKGIWFCLRSGAYIYDNYTKDINFWLSGGAKKINLWHGVGNKKINYDNKFDQVRHPKNKWEKFKTYLRRMSDEKPCHYILATSPIMANIFMSAFQTNSKHIIEEGYPRNDTLFPNTFTLVAQNVIEKSFIAILERGCKENKIFFYMPTFRDSEIKFFSVMNLERFNDFLVNKNYLYVTKLHPKSKIRKEFEQFQYSNIINVNADVDPYTLLKYADVLITDYSSIYSDFMLLNRPVIGFYYDYEEYSTYTRDGYFDFAEYMPEIKVRTMNELQVAMEQVIVEDKCKQERMKSRDRMFSNCDGNSSMRLTEKILKLMKN